MAFLKAHGYGLSKFLERLRIFLVPILLPRNCEIINHLYRLNFHIREQHSGSCVQTIFGSFWVLIKR